MSKNNLGRVVLWAFILLSILLAIFVDPKMILLVAGLALITLGSVRIFSKRFDEGIHKLFGESEIDKKFMSEKDRYLTRRYFSSIRAILLGLGLILIFALWYQPVFSRISGWFS